MSMITQQLSQLKQEIEILKLELNVAQNKAVQWNTTRDELNKLLQYKSSLYIKCLSIINQHPALEQLVADYEKTDIAAITSSSYKTDFDNI